MNKTMAREGSRSKAPTVQNCALNVLLRALRLQRAWSVSATGSRPAPALRHRTDRLASSLLNLVDPLRAPQIEVGFVLLRGNFNGARRADRIDAGEQCERYITQDSKGDPESAHGGL